MKALQGIGSNPTMFLLALTLVSSVLLLPFVFCGALSGATEGCTPNTSHPTDTSASTTGNACSTSTTAGTDSTKLTHSEALKMLSGAGITVTSSGNCSNRSSFSCTSLEQVRSKTIAGIIAFQKSSSCKITITGGTEYGHASTGTYSHWNGYKLDIMPTACVTQYIHSHFTYKGLRGGDHAPMYDDPSNNRYADEGSHWDIIYY